MRLTSGEIEFSITTKNTAGFTAAGYCAHKYTEAVTQDGSI